MCHSVAVETPESADEEEDPVCRILGAREFLSKRGRGGFGTESVRGYRVLGLRDPVVWGSRAWGSPRVVHRFTTLPGFGATQTCFLPRALGDNICMQSGLRAGNDHWQNTFTCAET